ncbi:MAG: spermidine/putrescine ABC transporter substrate-binding protein [Clostridia bacterium]|nr:spermidine/putrescine ABC transporter substrate-binding protein [Clostridia bacterium]
MKRFRRVFPVLMLLLIVALLAACSSNKSDEIVRVYNWGDYIAPGVLEQFEEETGIKVVYDTFETNEDMYLKLKNSSGYTYDVVIPSDYMLTKMLREDMLAELDFSNIPNAAGIDDRFTGLDYDPEGKYTVPYTWGTVCICYDPEQVTEPVTSWDILWDKKYDRRIFMIDSERDSIGVALMSLGYSLNSTDPDELEAAKQKLLAQKPMVLAYTGDDVKDKMIAREGALAVIWSCDIGQIREEDDTLAYAIPESGTNVWFDACAILKSGENKANGEAFINFLCRPDIAQLNADYLSAASPVTEAYQNQDDFVKDNPIVNPPAEDIARYEIFQLVDSAAYEEIWSYVIAS